MMIVITSERQRVEARRRCRVLKQPLLPEWFKEQAEVVYVAEKG